LAAPGVGPARLSDDQLHCSNAISDAQKRQILLNIVRLRYGDTPTFLALDQVISSYTLEQMAELGLNVYPNARPGNYGTGVATLNFSDHPTVTFAPLAGKELAQSVIQPPSPADLLPLAQSGMPIDVLFRLAVQSVGPLRNTAVLGGEEGAGTPEFFELLVELRRLQLHGMLTVRFVRQKDRDRVFLAISKGGDANLALTAARVRRLLGMSAGDTEAEIVYGNVASSPHQVAILTRSIIAILSQVSAEIDVPSKDVAAGRTIVSFSPSQFGLTPIIMVHSGSAEPREATTAVKYSGTWFWINDGDFNSKVAYTVLGLLIALLQAKAGGQSPVVTIPTGG
jgi:hypothetical protein